MESDFNSKVSTKEWVITLFVTALPVVGFIMLIIWAFGGDTKQSKANWAKGKLIWMSICLIVALLIIGTFGSSIIELIKEVPDFQYL